MIPPLNEAQERKLHEIYYVQGNMFGRDKLYQLLKRDPANDISRNQVNAWLQSQEVHQTFRKPVSKRHAVRPYVTKTTGTLMVDLLDMSSDPWRSYVAILVCVDVFSRKVYARAIKDKRSQTVLQAFRDIRNENPNMKVSRIISDQGGEFKEAFHDYLVSERITHTYTKAGHPWSNTFAEKAVGLLKRNIFMFMKANDRKDWPDFYRQLVDNHNGNFNFGIKDTPDIVDAAASTNADPAVKAARVIKNRAEKAVSTKGDVLKVGDLVRKLKKHTYATITKPSKVGYFNKTLYVVVRVTKSKYSNVAPSYKIRKVGSHEMMEGLFARWQLLKVGHQREEDVTENDEDEGEQMEEIEPERSPTPMPRRSTRQENVYEVEYVLDKRTVRQGRRNYVEYLVKWANFPESQATWERTSNLEGARDAIREFELTRRQNR